MFLPFVAQSAVSNRDTKRGMSGPTTALATLLLLVLAQACENGDSSCGSWAEGGECEKNRDFMKSTCAEACGFCKVPPLLEAADDALLGSERVVLQVSYGSPPQFGDIVLGFYPTVAPVTVAHILRLVRMGGYNTNEIFRVDKGFVAQVQGVDGGRRAPMGKMLREVAKKSVPDEFSSTLTHKRGSLSMGKFEAADTGTSSFSMVLGNAAFLDRKYTIFGRVVGGDHVLAKLEKLETKRDGIFVKPKERVEVVSAVVMYADGRGGLVVDEGEKRKVEL